jgi:hypothetical protein
METGAKSLEKRGVAEKTAAKSAAVSAGTTDQVQDLAAFLSKLPERMREALLVIAMGNKELE